MNYKDKFEACIIGGAIGDAWGSSFENESLIDDSTIYYLFGKQEKNRNWYITDDTQMTLATCEVLADIKSFNPEILIDKFIEYYRNNKLMGIGSATLKAIIDKEAGLHWSQAGRTGEYAAGNGVAMRIAPFAFFPNVSREDLFNACKITHRNDEAFVGALAVYLSIKAVLSEKWDGHNNLFDIIIPQLPDTNLRDRLIEINNLDIDSSIYDVAKLGNNGYVVNSVPFAIFCSSKILNLGLTQMFQEIIESGGDTDTNASIAGQIAGTLIGIKNIPEKLLSKLEKLNEYDWIQDIINRTALKIDN